MSLAETFKRYSYVIFLVIGYSLSAGLLVVINKWALTKYPYGANLTALQFSFSALIAWLVGALGIDEVDGLDRAKMWEFLPAVVMFYISVACNLKLLQHANVDTYIVVRACVPLLTCIMDIRFLGAPVPSTKTILSMLLIVASSAGYIYVDSHFAWSAYIWAILYLVAMAVDTILIKKVVGDVALTRWGLVFYNNFIALAFFPLGSMLTGDLSLTKVNTDSLNLLYKPDVLLPVIISCVVGVAISFFGLNTRKALAATSFTVLGVVNKFLTVLVNTLIWDRHSGPPGIMCVMVSIVGGVLYQFSMGSASITPNKEKPQEPDEKEPASLSK
ncbi:GDP-mannose transporter GONST3 [Diplonema papillatum]|nr:GDP-mannose transporter GONST3 [Diplonema papillatum]